MYLVTRFLQFNNVKVEILTKKFTLGPGKAPSFINSYVNHTKNYSGCSLVDINV